MPTTRERLERAVADMKTFADQCDAKPGGPTGTDLAEVKRRSEEVSALAAHIKATHAGDTTLAALNGAAAPDWADPSLSAPGAKSGFAQAVIAAGFDLKTKSTVTIDGLAVKAPTFPSMADLAPTARALVASGQDRRWLWPNLPTQSTDGATAIEDFKQTARTLTGTVKRALDATTDKANVDVTLALVNEPLAQFAVTINDIPNAVLESVPSFSAFMESEGRFQVESAIDTHVMAQIVAATPPFGQTGTTLIDKVRNGIATMRATGADPSLLVVNPTDGASLDLTADAGGYVFASRDVGTSSPLWNQKVIERIGAGNEAPYLIDPSMLGVLYMGSMQFAADPFSGFRKNLTTLRIEVNALFHVRNVNGARRIAAS